MNEPESPLGGPSAASIEELQDDLQSLKTLFSVALVVLIVASICINIIFFKQITVLHAETESARQTAGLAASRTYGLYAELYAYAAQHPEYRASLDKYSGLMMQIAPPRTNAPPAKK